MLLSMTLVFTACNDDRDSNPTLVQPATFTLNNPVNTLVDLAASTGIPFEWSQPDYGGWPAAVEYQLEVSPTNDENSWKVSTDEAAADETGATVADYAILPSFYASCKGVMLADELAKALVQICQWDENSVPEKQTVYVRCSAVTPGATKVYSNVVSLEVNPYYIELADAPIELWYLVGEGIGGRLEGRAERLAARDAAWAEGRVAPQRGRAACGARGRTHGVLRHRQSLRRDFPCGRGRALDGNDRRHSGLRDARRHLGGDGQRLVLRHAVERRRQMAARGIGNERAWPPEICFEFCGHRRTRRGAARERGGGGVVPAAGAEADRRHAVAGQPRAVRRQRRDGVPAR